MGDVLRQGVQAEVQDANEQDGRNQDDRHDRHEVIGLAGGCDEGRQMVRCSRVIFLAHVPLGARAEALSGLA
jgi:hypothetical protein